MSFNQSDWVVLVLLAVLGLSVLIAVAVIIKTFMNDAAEKKERVIRIAKAEQSIAHQQQAHAMSQVQAKPAAKAEPTKPKPKPQSAPAHKDDVNEGDDLLAAAEVYLTYELKEQAIISLEKHLLTHPNDEKALALLIQAETSS